MQIDWQSDPRVSPLLADIARNGLSFESYQDYSNSSWGMKSYAKPVGAAYSELAAIYNEWLDRVYYAGDMAAFDAFCRLPKPQQVAIEAAQKVAA